VTTNTDVGKVFLHPLTGGWRDKDNWNELTVNKLMSNNWRASLVPAAAVIPAPRVYIKVVAVKKLVV